MSIIWNKIFADQAALQNTVYNLLKAVEADADWLTPSLDGASMLLAPKHFGPSCKLEPA